MSYLINSSEILQTIQMIDQQHLDVRTVTMGISLLDCADRDIQVCCSRIYEKICRRAEKLVETGCAIEQEFGIPIVNKRVSVTPISLVAASCAAAARNCSSPSEIVWPIWALLSIFRPARCSSTVQRSFARQ